MKTQIRITKLISFSSAIFSLSICWAETNKSQYSLLNPVPHEQLRELSTDRPDKTESPYTVDAGHIQIESDVYIFSLDEAKNGASTTKTNSFSVMPTNFKIGLTSSSDLQIVLAPYESEKTTVDGVKQPKVTGFGDTVVRFKYNVFGNDGGDIALGLMPFVEIPTHSADLGSKKVQGGLIVPLAVSLPNNFGLGLMAQFNYSKNDANDQYHVEFVSSMTVAHDLTEHLGGYAEFFSQSSAEAGSSWVATFDVGLTYGLTSNLQLDAGCNFGLTDSADDYNPFVGASVRF